MTINLMIVLTIIKRMCLILKDTINRITISNLIMIIQVINVTIQIRQREVILFKEVKSKFKSRSAARKLSRVPTTIIRILKYRKVPGHRKLRVIKSTAQ